jgi:hypothetical protein
MLRCFFNELNKSTDKNEKTFINNSINGDYNTIIEGDSNVVNSNNITNNNMYIEIKTPIPFDSEWDISKIEDIIKERCIFSTKMYTALLEEILKNEINLNVIIDKENDSGIVYKNDIDKYIKMKSKDIVDNTMDKLKNHLLEINTNSDKNCLIDCLDASKKIIKKKYDKYNNDKNLQKHITTIISDIYETKKGEAITISKNSENNENNENIDNIKKYNGF